MTKVFNKREVPEKKARSPYREATPAVNDFYIIWCIFLCDCIKRLMLFFMTYMQPQAGSIQEGMGLLMSDDFLLEEENIDLRYNVNISSRYWMNYEDWKESVRNKLRKTPVSFSKKGTNASRKYYAQAGMDYNLKVTGFMNQFKSFFVGKIFDSDMLIDRAISEYEDALLLFLRIRDCKSWVGVMANIVTQVKRKFTSSLSSQILRCIQEIFGYSPLQMTQQSGISETTQWLETLQACYGNWKLAIANEGFGKISRLFSLLIGAGMMEMSNLNLDVCGLKLFSDLSVPKHVSAFDLADALVNTVMFFIEGGYECIRTGSIKPLLYGEHDLRNFDDNFLLCSKYADYARPGNLDLVDIDENDLEKLFADTIASGKILVKTLKNTLTRKYTLDRLVKLQDMQSKFTQHRQSGNIREKPYCVGIYGTSSVGKSTIGPLIMTSALHFNGFRCDDESTIVLNEHDKYMSNYKSSINGVFLDDVGNTKEKYVETAPTVRILELVNNVKMYANMAEAEMKGKVSIQPKFVVATTNTKDFCATTYSEEPVSIARRANYILTVTIKPEFSTNNMLDENKVFAHYGDVIPQIPDLWYFKVEKAYPIKCEGGFRDKIGWKTIVWNGKPLDKICIGELIQFTNADSREHYANQRKVVLGISHLSTKMDFCEICRSPIRLCMCGMDQHVVTYASPDISHKRFSKQAGVSSPPEEIYLEEPSVESWLTTTVTREWDNIWSRMEALYSYRSVSWLAFVPNYIFDSVIFRRLLSMWYVRWPSTVCYLHFIIASCVTYICTYIFIGRWSLLYSFFMGQICLMWTWRNEFNMLVELSLETRNADRMILHERSKRVAYVLGISATVAGLYYMLQAYRKNRYLVVPHAMLFPTDEEIEAKDANDITPIIAKEMNWDGLEVNHIPVSHRSKTMTFDQLKRTAQQNLTFMSYDIGNKQFATDCFFVASNVALIPRHAWKSDNMKCTFMRHSDNKAGGNFSAYISRSQSIDIPDIDMSLIWVPNGGSWKNLLDFFPKEYPDATFPAELFWKDHAGNLISSKLRFESKMVNNSIMTFKGGEYVLTIPTKVGMCMSPVISETKEPFIAGFHLGGITGRPFGCAGTIIRSQVEAAMDAISELPGVILSHNSGTLSTIKYGVQFFESTEVHDKSPIRRIVSDKGLPNIEVYGSCIGRATYHSSVQDSFITDHVYDVCKVPNIWGKPSFNNTDPWYESLTYSAFPSCGIEGNLLSAAVKDYQRSINNLLDDRSKLLLDMQPLSRMEIVAGIDGKRFIDKMPPNTSIGFPLGGPKKNHLTYLDPDDYDGVSCPVELDSMFWDEFDSACNIYAKGERYYPVFKACLKDEPTVMTKKKVRVFQAAPIVLQMLTRKYYLPIVRILSLFPTVSECAVGVNCMGPEWSALCDHMSYFGKDRILAGDYSKYDLRMPAQVMFAAFRILIDMAAKSGYSDDDLVVMRGIATDICYPVMAYNGDLLQLIGSNPSGQNLTVYINSIVNSLLFRASFFHLKGVDYKHTFQSVCKLMTYGDDAKGSVKQGHDDFNHIYVAKFFKTRDMVFTMPDKTSVPVPFMCDDEADFLKRRGIWSPETGHVMGALHEDSIFKSLHSNLESKELTKQQLAASVIDGALREWFNHGREVYEHRRQQMCEIALRSDITHICTTLDLTYDDCVQQWMERYRIGEI